MIPVEDKDTEAKKVPEVLAAEKMGVPMETSKVPTETSKGIDAEKVQVVAAAQTPGVPMEASASTLDTIPILGISTGGQKGVCFLEPMTTVRGG